MKRLMAICIVALALWLPASAYAAVLSFDVIQHRKNENGDEYNRIVFSFKQSGNYITDNILKTVQLFDPDGTEIPLTNISFGPSKGLYGSYNSANGTWTYGNSYISEGWYYARFADSIRSGQYRLKVTDTSDIVYEATKTVTGTIANLPIITSQSFYAYRDSSGNLIWIWSRPTNVDPGLNTVVRAQVAIYKNAQAIGVLFVTVPTNMGYIIVPNDVFQKVLAEGDEFRLGIELRTTDNLNRSYSNFPKIEEVGIPFFDINGDRKMGLEELIYLLKIISGLNVGEAGILFFDIDGDGKMGLPEVIYLLQIICGLR